MVFGWFRKDKTPAAKPAALAHPPDNDPLCLVFIPALVAILHRAETVHGSPLDQVQVEAIRDKAA